MGRRDGPLPCLRYFECNSTSDFAEGARKNKWRAVVSRHVVVNYPLFITSDDSFKKCILRLSNLIVELVGRKRIKHIIFEIVGLFTIWRGVYYSTEEALNLNRGP